MAVSQKYTLFTLKKNVNSIFYEAKPETYLKELFVMRSCTHLPCLGTLSLCMLVFCDLQGHLGGKA
jgi:hypothetical protein